MVHWVRERELVRIRKESGEAPPWTSDPIISSYRFCNVRREDDRVTAWVRKNVREPFAGHPYLWLMLCICRQINWPDTLEEMIQNDAWPSHPGFDPAARRMIHGSGASSIREVLESRKARGEKVYTGAYMVPAPPTKIPKERYMAETVFGGLWGRRETFPGGSVEAVHSWLTQTNGWGNFMAYQACVDMIFTPILGSAPDRSSWCAAGPGTVRGLNRIHGRAVDHPLSQDRARDEVRALYGTIQSETGVAMDFTDVPNVMCETDKYLRVLNGEGKPRAGYSPEARTAAVDVFR